MEDNKVAVLLEDLRAQFRVFGESLQMLNEKMDRGFKEIKDEIREFKEQNRQEHQQLQQAIAELDTEVVKLKRVK
ncbi:MAG TPA: hypothetical protein VF531_03790 [Bacillota bacterium]